MDRSFIQLCNYAPWAVYSVHFRAFSSQQGGPHNVTVLVKCHNYLLTCIRICVSCLNTAMGTQRAKIDYKYYILLKSCKSNSVPKDYRVFATDYSTLHSTEIEILSSRLSKISCFKPGIFASIFKEVSKVVQINLVLCNVRRIYCDD